MNWQIFSYAVIILLIILIAVFIYGAVRGFKTKNIFLGFVFVGFAIAMGIATYAVFGNTIIGLFKK